MVHRFQLLPRLLAVIGTFDDTVANRLGFGLRRADRRRHRSRYAVSGSSSMQGASFSPVRVARDGGYDGNSHRVRSCEPRRVVGRLRTDACPRPDTCDRDPASQSASPLRTSGACESRAIARVSSTSGRRRTGSVDRSPATRATARRWAGRRFRPGIAGRRDPRSCRG